MALIEEKINSSDAYYIRPDMWISFGRKGVKPFGHVHLPSVDLNGEPCADFDFL